MSGCATPSSKTRKSSIRNPRTATPSAPITLHVTGTICVTTEMACVSAALPPSPVPVALIPFAPPPVGIAVSSPVAGSRFQVRSSSRRRGRGSFVFCWACSGTTGRAKSKLASAIAHRTAGIPKRGVAPCARSSPVIRRGRIARLIEVEIAQWFFDGPVFRLLQSLGEFSSQHIFLRFLRFHRRAEFRLHRVHLLAQQARCVVQVHRGRRLRRWHMGQYHANLAIDRELRLAARATNGKRV